MSLSDDELAALFLSPNRLQVLSDEDLMAALRIGCNDAFAVLYERYRIWSSEPHAKSCTMMVKRRRWLRRYSWSSFGR
jgi:hypothetical protein